jgi:hypothetical protein
LWVVGAVGVRELVFGLQFIVDVEFGSALAGFG